MNDYIAKPFDHAQMIETLAKWIVPAQPQGRAVVETVTPGGEALPELPAAGELRLVDDIPLDTGGCAANTGIT